MKIISIKKEGPELWKIKYKTLFGSKERLVIREEKPTLITFPFVYRDNGEMVHSSGGNEQIKWMIKNDIESFEN